MASMFRLGRCRNTPRIRGFIRQTPLVQQQHGRLVLVEPNLFLGACVAFSTSPTPVAASSPKRTIDGRKRHKHRPTRVASQHVNTTTPPRRCNNHKNNHKPHPKLRHNNYKDLIRQWTQQGRTDKVLELYQNLVQHPSNPVTNVLVVHVIKAIAKSKTIQDKGPCAQKVTSQALQQWNKHQQQDDLYGLNQAVLNAMIYAWSKTNSNNRGQHARALLQQLIHSPQLQPNVASYAMTIHALREDPLEALGVLNLLKANPLLQPNVVIYTSVMKAFQNDVDKCRALFLEMQHNHHISPNVQAYSVLMSSLVNSKSSLSQVLDLFQTMVESGVKPDIHIYNGLMHAWVKSNHPQAATKVTEIMQKHIPNSNCRPTISSFNTWIHAIGKGRGNSDLHKTPQEQAHDVLRDLIDQYLQHDNHDKHPPILPVALTYSAVMQAWAKSHDLQAPLKCEELLRQMQQGYSRSNKRIPPISPTIQCYDALLDAWARCKDNTTTTIQDNPTNNNMAVKRVLEILQYLESSNTRLQPTTRTYNAVLMALSRRPGQAAEAQEILDQMLQSKIQPNIHCWTSVLSAWANEGNHAKAHDLLKRLEQSSVRPNIVAYTCVMVAYAKHGKTDEIQALMDQANLKYKTTHCVETKPNTVSYNALLQGYANVETIKSARTAQELALSLWHESDLKPDVVTFSTVLQAWAKLGQGQAALDWLQQMHQLAKQDATIKPNTISYTTVIKAFSIQSQQEEEQDGIPQERVLCLLQDMQHYQIPMNHVVYTTAMETLVKNANYLKKAQDLLQIMTHETKQPPPVYAFQLLYKALLNQGENAAARDVLRQQERFHPKSSQK